MTPIVTIILPIAADDQHLADCIASLQRQTINEIEVLMIACSPSPRSAAIAKETAAKDPRFVFINETQASRVYQARNIGIQKARGTWLAFVDDSDVLSSKCFETALNLADLHQADSVGWDGVLMQNSIIRPVAPSPRQTTVYRSLSDKEILITALYIPEMSSFSGGEFLKSCKAKIFKTSIMQRNNIVFSSNLRDNVNLLFLITYLKNCKAVVVSNEFLQRSVFKESQEQYIFKPELMDLQLGVFDQTRRILLPLNVPLKKIEYKFWNGQERDFIHNWMKGNIPLSTGLYMTARFLSLPLIRSCLINGKGKSRPEKIRTYLLTRKMYYTASVIESLIAYRSLRPGLEEQTAGDKENDSLSLQELMEELSALEEKPANMDLLEEREATTLDESYPYEELYMVRRPPFAYKEPVLPAGFYWNTDPQLIRSQWINNLVKLGFVHSLEEAARQWDKMEAEDSEFFHSHLYALVSDTGSLAAVVGIWNSSQVPGKKRLHWMMTTGNYQRKGLGRLVIQKALHEFSNQFPAEEIYLSTQAQSWPAIKLYETEGFVSVETQTTACSAEENAARWKRARESVLRKENIVI